MYYSNVEDFRRNVYERYRFFWLIEHDFTVEDLLNSVEMAYGTLGALQSKRPEAWEYIEALEENGMFCFEDEIWSSYRNFMQNEYRDRKYVERFLPDGAYFLYHGDVDSIESREALEETEDI